MGRKRKVNNEMIKRFLDYYCDGLNYSQIGRIEDVSRDTVRNYLLHEGNTDYLNFRAREMGHEDWHAYRMFRNKINNKKKE